MRVVLVPVAGHPPTHQGPAAVPEPLSLPGSGAGEEHRQRDGRAEPEQAVPVPTGPARGGPS